DDDQDNDDDPDNDDDEGDDDERIDSDNDGDDFVHLKFSTYNEEDKEEDSFDPRGNLVGRDTKMTDAPRTIIQTTQVIEDTHVIITPVNPEDVPVTTIAEPPLLSTTTLPLPPTPLITHLQQTPILTPATALSSSLQDLPNFGSLFGLRDEAQAKNVDFINKLDDNIKKIIKDQVKEQVKAQVSKILPKIEKTVNEQLEAEVLTRSSNESKTSHAVAANLSELELKRVLIDKMESNKSIHRSNEQKNLYKALVDAYESDKLILNTYGETISFKRRRNEEDKDEEPSAGSNRGSKRRRAGKEPESTSSPKEKTSKTKAADYGNINRLKIWSLTQCGVKCWESTRDVYSKRRIIAVTKLQIVEWHNYKHLDWITVRRDDDKLYTFKEGDFNRLRIQDIEDMLLLLVQGKLTNLTVEERLAFNVSLQMFTRSIIIQRRVEDLQLGVESYQKKLNLTKPDTYRLDLK
ncbi:hypothetical protein Tco_1470666, partial [Tanacetum coccineum]